MTDSKKVLDVLGPDMLSCILATMDTTDDFINLFGPAPVSKSQRNNSAAVTSKNQQGLEMFRWVQQQSRKALRHTSPLQGQIRGFCILKGCRQQIELINLKATGI